MDEAQKRLESRLSTASAMEINEEKYRLIRDGIPVTVKKSGGRQETRLAAVIDFKHPQENHFLAIEELNIDGPLHHRRADIVGFVNGLPLLFVELKKHDVDVENAYTDISGLSGYHPAALLLQRFCDAEQRRRRQNRHAGQ